MANNTYSVPTYDKDGNVTYLQLRQSNWQTGTILSQVKKEYDGMGRVIKAHSYNNGNWTTPYATVEYDYDEASNLVSSTDPRNLTTTYEYDEAARLLKTTLPDGDWVEKRYNPLGQMIKSWTSARGSESSPAVSSTYDGFDRLSRTDYITGEYVEYTYDLNDNLLSLTTYDGSQTYTYDTEGNLTQRGSGNNYDSLSFQSFGCAPKQIQKVRGGSVQETISYGYDGMGQRVKVTDSEGTQYFLYDSLMPVLELDSGKNTTASYVYGANGVIYRRKPRWEHRMVISCCMCITASLMRNCPSLAIPSI